MSMSHELMMRKKEQIMYATIKGSLTESPEGVFSGFSASNYLALQQNFAPEGSWEVCVKIKTRTTITSPVRYFFGCWGTGNIVIGTTTGTYFKAFISTNNGSSYNVTLTTTSAVSTETVYYVKLGFTGTKYYLEQSTDGVNFVGRAEYSSSAKISSYPVNFGKVYANDNIWNGDIDLNNSYIKIDNTKYKLQAVVGYTTVGSPTITDGVVSGFSGANCLTLPTINITEGTPFNIITKISTPADYQGNWLLAFVTSSSRIYCLSQAPVFRYLSNGTATNLSFNYTMVFNTTYILEVKYDGNKLKVIIYDENKNILSSNEVEDTKVVFFNGSYTIGSNRSNQFFNGSIDMNETDIKINNKLWFNGQQA